MFRLARHRAARTVVPLAAIAAVAAAPSAASAGAAKPQGDRALTRALDATLARTAATTGDPGLQAVAMRDGRLLWSSRRGVAIDATRRRVDDRTLFSFASFGKLMLAAYALRLVEQGRLDLDKPIAAYVGDDVAGSDVVTARMLLTHTAGYPEESPETAPLFGDQYDPNRTWTFAMLVAGMRPLDPGARWEYSNTGYRVLAHVLSKIAGKPLERAYMEFIRPAGAVRPMDERMVTMRRSPQALARIAHGYDVDADGTVHDSFAGADGIPTDLYSLPFGDGAFAGTALGAAQVLDGLYARGTLLRPATVRRMIAPTPQSLAIGGRYGMGTQRYTVAGREWQGHRGTFGGFTAFGATDMQRGVTIAIVANRQPADRHPAQEIWTELAEAYARGAR